MAARSGVLIGVAGLARLIIGAVAVPSSPIEVTGPPVAIAITVASGRGAMGVDAGVVGAQALTISVQLAGGAGRILAHWGIAIGEISTLCAGVVIIAHTISVLTCAVITGSPLTAIAAIGAVITEIIAALRSAIVTLTIFAQLAIVLAQAGLSAALGRGHR